MFLFTMTKPGLRQAGALALCAVCLTGAIAAAVHFSGETVPTGAAAESGIETTQDIAEFFTGGLCVSGGFFAILLIRSVTDTRNGS